ncbi:MAG: hypothetical protein JSV88_30060 [Candidatus Aminicenantes bacterium]|nr:MAG: hypothetical protein JSV88_30060 [Candidatus Aminicenantes bacterium]
MIKIFKLLLIICLLVFMFSSLWASEGKWLVDIEGGFVIPGYNNVQIPNNESGTRFSLKNDLEIDRKAYYRLRLSYRIGKRHGLSLLYAPLSLNAGGTLNQPVDFEGVRFDSGSSVSALYKFNSYRLTYKYQLVAKPKLNFWIGFTAKIRDAEVKIEDNAKESSSTNVGFVPLLHVYLEWIWGNRLGFLFEADALAAKQGRAEDVAAAIFYKLGKNVRLKFGYRFVEGGADVDEVYTFAMINYFYGGLIFRF